MFRTGNMQYRNFGNTGLKVSVISLGVMVNSQFSVDDMVQVLKVCFENGINHFDTAELYSGGENQKLLGEALRKIGEDRSKLVISTKVWTSPDPSLNSTRNSNRKHIKQAVKGSLKRLQMDYVDVLYAHGHDQSTPLQEICRAFHEVIQDGDAFYWATSNWDADVVMRAFQICQKYNLHKPIGAQNYYNMVNREQAEQEYRKLFEVYNYGLVGYAALMGGLLTGKYIEDDKKEGRYNNEKVAGQDINMMKSIYLSPFDVEKVNKNLKQVRDIAEKQLNCNLTQLAVAWVIKFPYTSSSMVGAKNPSQIQDILKCLQVVDKLTPEIQGKINKIMGTSPGPRMDWKKFAPQAHFRPLAQ